MSGLKIIGRNHLFHTRYNPRNVLPPTASRIHAQPANPTRPRIAHMYKNMDRNTLWWFVTPVAILDERRVVRSWCCRRLRIAFKEALRKKGYDEQGRKVVRDDGDIETKTVGHTGTLLLGIEPGFKKERPEKIQEKADEVVDLLIERSQKPKNPR